MRATPSPTDITVPTSLTLTVRSKFSICSRIISVISSGLIFAIFICFCSPELSGRQLLAKTFKVTLDGTVINRAADAGLNAAQQFLLAPELHFHTLAGQLCKFLPKRLFLLRRQVLGIQNLHLYNSEPVIGNLLESLQNLFQQRHSVIHQQNAQEVSRRYREPKLLNQGIQNASFLLNRNRGADQGFPQFIALSPDAGEILQFLLHCAKVTLRAQRVG